MSDRLRFNYEEPDATGGAADIGPPIQPAAEPGPGAMRTRRYFEDGGYAEIGDPIPGSGLPADQVDIKPTNIKPYMQIPGLAQAEADVAKARYGGSSIQDSATPPPYAEPKAGGAAGAMPVHNRNRFEGEVYNELGGNPFEINVVKRMNDVTAKDMPALFSKVFKGQVVWEDRNKLNKNQQAFWQESVKNYRAHVKESLESERKTKIDVYNHMMKTFDNDAKEQEAAEKRVREQEKDWAAQTKSDRTDTKDTQKQLDGLQRDKRNILKRQSEILKTGVDLATGKISKESEPEFMELAEQLRRVNEESEKILMRTSPDHWSRRVKERIPSQSVSAHAAPAPDTAAAPAAPAAPAVQGSSGSPSNEPDLSALEPTEVPLSRPKPSTPTFKPHPKGNPVEVRRNKDGQLMGKFKDGSIVFLEEVKQ